MNAESLVELARAFYERLNGLPEAAQYLRMFNRSVEFRSSGEPAFHFTVQDGRLTVGAGAAPAGEMSALRADPETLLALLTGRVSFYEAGGGYAKNLRCTGGISYYPDISWVGILTRLAQEHR